MYTCYCLCAWSTDVLSTTEWGSILIWLFGSTSSKGGSVLRLVYISPEQSWQLIGQDLIFFFLLPYWIFSNKQPIFLPILPPFFLKRRTKLAPLLPLSNSYPHLWPSALLFSTLSTPFGLPSPSPLHKHMTRHREWTSFRKFRTTTGGRSSRKKKVKQWQTQTSPAHSSPILAITH